MIRGCDPAIYEYGECEETEEVADWELDEVEKVDDPLENCILPYLPEGRAAGTAAFFDGKIIFCGGFYNKDDRAECFELSSANDEWSSSISLPLEISHLQSSIVDGKWLLSGGTSLGTRRSGTLVYENGIFVPGPDLPKPKHHHCQVTIDDTHVFFTAGLHSDDTFILDFATGQWTFLDDIPLSMEGSGCGLLNNPVNGPGKMCTRVDQVAQVSLEIMLPSHEVSYIFSLRDREWRQGPEMPESVSRFESVQLDDGFMVVGGLNGDDQRSSFITQTMDSNYNWNVNLEGLSDESRTYSSSVNVPNDFLNC